MAELSSYNTHCITHKAYSICNVAMQSKSKSNLEQVFFTYKETYLERLNNS